MTAKKVGTVTVNDLKKPPTLFPEFQVINGTYQDTEFTRLGVNKSEEVGALKESAALQKGPSEAITINPESIRKPLSINATMGNNTSHMPSNVESSNFASLNVTKAQSLTLPKSWDGLTMAKAGSPGCTPPDGGLGAGPNHILQMVNVGGIIWTKNGTRVSQFALRDFFQTKMDRLSDPEVIYDNMSGRWFTSIFDITKESTQVSVSATDDPTGKWFVYQFPFVSCPDQPRIGTSDSLFVVSVNDFGSKCTDGFVGVQYAICNSKAILLME